ncbi:MAG TPA: hypothetical protein VMF32_26590 [Xanthobacteraceae bacterium]|nr:hypothetical protein [Xanthobacteraceae bacterium]
MLDHPPAWQNGEADLVWVFDDDLDDGAGCSGDTLAGMVASGELGRMTEMQVHSPTNRYW